MSKMDAIRDLSQSSTGRRLLLGAGIATALLAVAGCKGQDGPARAPPPPEVKVAPVRVASIPYTRNFVGHIAAYRSVEVRARVEGILEKRHYSEGNDVALGQLLYSIDPAPYEATLRDAEAELASARADVANARVREARYGPLVKENAISKQDYDDALAQLRQAEAAVQSAKAKVDRAKLNLGYTKVYATEAGRIGATLVPEGRLVGRGEPTHLATIEKLDPIYVNFTVSDRDLLAFRSDQESGLVKGDQTMLRARILLPDGSAYEQPGKIDFADMRVNEDSGTITARAVVPNPVRRLLPGMFVNVELLAGERPDTLLIPQDAVIKVPNGHMAWVVTPDGKAERRDLVVGQWFGKEWIIDKGLGPDDKVVVEGMQRLAPGMPVNATVAGEATPSAAAGTAQATGR
ncbi:efflux RND transporter periplasmic adaptor subunit [Aromatoleum sp.]|uniref:efflux RND transporter periplasmic adaptor subunit n=1 Tax=Aromatoleum sp. TaxID=2307007 RepID=UPI002FCB0692